MTLGLWLHILILLLIINTMHFHYVDLKSELHNLETDQPNVAGLAFH